jgi:glycosyltransferase involved in cell wall biosynthesis
MISKKNSLSNFSGAVVLTSCEFDLDPRHEYWFNSLKLLGCQVLRMEVTEEIPDTSVRRQISYRGGLLTAGANRAVGDREFPGIVGLSALPAYSPLGRYLKARLARMLHSISHEALTSMRPSLVIANDLLGAILATVMWGKTECVIIYDAQEVFTDSYDLLGGPTFSHRERQAWIEIETRICQRANLVVTISPGIAELYESRHGVRCAVLPNYVPVERHISRTLDSEESPTKFVLLGRADPYRGLEQLVDSWDVPKTVATLDLIMPETEQRKKLENRSSRIKRKHSGPTFLPPVKPDDMVSVLRSYDVGILPYNYPYPYSHASPNKFGEYIAAGLVVLASNQPFVASQINQFGVGRVFDWNNENEFLIGIYELSMRDNLNVFKRNVDDAAINFLNWEAAGKSVLQFIYESTSRSKFAHQNSEFHWDTSFQFVEKATLVEKWRSQLRQVISSLAKKVVVFVKVNKPKLF